MDAQITRDTCQKHITNGLPLAIAEIVEGVFVQNRDEGSVFGVFDNGRLLLDGI